jgi:hypothetical protein
MSSIDTGTYTNRFYLAFTNGELGLSEVEFDNILINYLHDTGEIYIKTINKSMEIQQVSIVNIIGQVVTTFEPKDFNYVNSSEIRIPVSSISEGTYILKIESNLGLTSKKVIIGY